VSGKRPKKSSRKKRLKCPKCGSRNTRRIKGEGKSYSTGCGALGCLIAWPLGIVMAILGADPERIKVKCLSCGNVFLPPEQRRQKILRDVLFILAILILIAIMISSLLSAPGASLPGS